MEALVRLEAPSMVWAKIRELPIQAVMEKLQQRRLSISGDEETLRVRLFRARCKALPNSNQLDVPWDPETDEEPEQDEKSLNETILQTKNQQMERNTNEEQRRSFAPLSGEQPEGLHRQSGRRWTGERGRRAPRETPARRQEPAKRRWLS
ncbi:unnamed protein product [Trichogramma brassicae]|uniref:Uncharacterized protein n=1 Tax=Trichogramma brassicae TaxID=86971 RepID=A0A6H5J484_9HYME|nr:unnamed protein product [Trichogramma brassicae]